MPIYEYYCPECEITFEKRKSFSEADSPVDCIACDYTNAQRKISMPAIVFKGSGFYINDSRSNGKSSKNGNGKSSSNEATSKPNEAKDKSENTSKSDSKTEAKTKTKPKTAKEKS